MPIDNRRLVAPFVPEVFDGDTFLYTELLDRRKRSGNNRGRIVRTFYHRARADFLEQGEQVVELCEALQVRAYTRLQRRSFRLVGMAYTKIIVEQALTANWEGMRHAYAKACGTTPPVERLWLFDADNTDQMWMLRPITESPSCVAVIPSRKGWHVIVRPFDLRELAPLLEKAGIEVHKDNPTNLYIPDGAA